MASKALRFKTAAGTVVEPRRAHYAVLAAVCALVIGVYAWSAKSGWLELRSLEADNTYYNLLVRGFRAGQLNLKREVPPGLAESSNSSDPSDLRPYLAVKYPLFEQSYYQGKLYLYFGVTPALVLFWPYVALTGHYLLHQDAVALFFAVGFLASVGLLWAVWQRYFAEVRVGVVAACALALGLANFTLAILRRCDVYEVAISCGYALTMVALMLLWRALHSGRGRGGWLARASLAYGLAVGARPSLLFGAIILAVPVTTIWWKKREPGQQSQLWSLLLAAVGPIAVIGLGLLLYNYLRFDDPLEFGQRYQLPAGPRQQQFSLRYLWSNFWVGFLALARWSGHFPFVHDIVVPPLPKGAAVEQLPFGVLTNTPLVWLALATPLAWRSQLVTVRSALRGFLGAVVLLLGTCALTLCLHNSMTLRYEVEFASPLVLLAVIGIIGLERVLADWPVWRRAARWSWGVLLGFSLAFNGLAMFEQSAQASVLQGVFSFQAGQLDKAIAHFREALALQPDNARAHNGLGTVLLEQGRAAEAINEGEQVLRRQPDDAVAHMTLGLALFEQGKVPEAVAHYQQALRVQPDSAEAHGSLATALFEQGKVAEAIAHYQQALRIQPDSVEGHYNLGTALMRLGKVAEAIGHLERALQLKPDFGNAHNNLTVALVQLGQGLAAQGKWDEAIQHLQRAVEMKPDNAQAQDSLGLVLSRQRKFAEAVGHYQRAFELDPRLLTVQNHLAWLLATCRDGAVRKGARAVELAEGANQLAGGKDAVILDTLAAAYAEAGRFGDAMRTAQAAIELEKANGRSERARAIQERLKLYQAGRPYHQE